MSRVLTVVVLGMTVLVGGGFAAWYFGWPIAHPQQPSTAVPHPSGERLAGGRGKPSGFGLRLVGPDEHYSNILPADYVGPDACRKCHEKQYQGWSDHPHRFMNQLSGPASIKGDFANHVWVVRPGYSVTFSTEGTDYWMTVDRPGQKRTRYKVTRTVGSRFVQLYIGVQTEGPEPPGDPRYTSEHKLPFVYWFRLKQWLPAEYFDAGDDYPEEFAEGNQVLDLPRGTLYLRTPRDPETLKDGMTVVTGVDVAAPFSAYANCVHCHNTYPHAFRLFRPSLRGFPAALIEPDPKPLSAALADKVAVAPDADSFAFLPAKLDPKKDLVTVGISCESCHFGGREHAAFGKDISFFPTNPHVRVTARSEEQTLTGKRADPATSQGICAQCHSSHGVYTYPNRARIRNAAEALELAEGSCATRIRCVNCHEPHTVGVPSGGPALPKHLDACVSCHPKFSTPEQASAHSRHGASAGVNCMDCHMPRISQGVDEVTRTHRISPPLEQSMISQAAPNACNLCHLDKSVRWSLDELKKGWGRDIQPLDTTPPGSLDHAAGEVWLKSTRPISRLVALDAYSRTPLWKAKLPEVLRGLNDEQPTNRAFALFAFERMLGRPLQASEIDVRGGPAQRRKQIEILQAAMQKKQ